MKSLKFVNESQICEWEETNQQLDDKHGVYSSCYDDIGEESYDNNYFTNSSTISSCSSYLDNSHSQREEVCNEVLLSVDELSDLLTLDFDRYANLSKDVCSLPCFALSCDEVFSPQFDVEENLVLEYI